MDQHGHGHLGDELLRLSEVSVRLAGREILHGVSFTIRPGEFTGLIGPNGAGKTTLLRVILGLQPAASGTVDAGGPLRTSRAGRAGRGGRGPLIGYVPQKLMIDPDMPLRVRDVVALGLDGHKLGFRFPSRARRDLVSQALRDVGAHRYADARIGDLSGGEQQRVLIAHALISRPHLLLLDEPLASLDMPSAQGIVTLLARLAREQRVAVLVSAHDMNPLVPVMDRIVYVAAGRAAVGSCEEVVRTDVLSRLYGHHVDVLRVHGRILVVAGTGTGTGAGSPGEPGVPGVTGAVAVHAGTVPDEAGHLATDEAGHLGEDASPEPLGPARRGGVA